MKSIKPLTTGEAELKAEEAERAGYQHLQIKKIHNANGVDLSRSTQVYWYPWNLSYSCGYTWKKIIPLLNLY